MPGIFKGTSGGPYLFIFFWQFHIILSIIWKTKSISLNKIVSALAPGKTTRGLPFSRYPVGLRVCTPHSRDSFQGLLCISSLTGEGPGGGWNSMVWDAVELFKTPFQSQILDLYTTWAVCPIVEFCGIKTEFTNCSNSIVVSRSMTQPGLSNAGLCKVSGPVWPRWMHWPGAGPSSNWGCRRWV